MLGESLWADIALVFFVFLWGGFFGFLIGNTKNNKINTYKAEDLTLPKLPKTSIVFGCNFCHDQEEVIDFINGQEVEPVKIESLSNNMNGGYLLFYRKTYNKQV